MSEVPDLLLFCGASLALLVLPGPAVLFVVTRSLHLGLRSGLVSAAGVECGTLLHVAAATVGLSAVLASSSAAFSVVKVAGVAYLVWLGLRQLLGRGSHADAAPGGHSGRRLLLQGLAVEALNPKTALFFLAYLPQFVRPEQGAVAAQVAVLGLSFVALACLVDVAYALGAAALRHCLPAAALRSRLLDRVSGGAHLGLAALAATARRAATV